MGASPGDWGEGDSPTQEGGLVRPDTRAACLHQTPAVWCGGQWRAGQDPAERWSPGALISSTRFSAVGRGRAPADVEACGSAQRDDRCEVAGARKVSCRQSRRCFRGEGAALLGMAPCSDVVGVRKPLDSKL